MCNITDHQVREALYFGCINTPVKIMELRPWAVDALMTNSSIRDTGRQARNWRSELGGKKCHGDTRVGMEGKY